MSTTTAQGTLTATLSSSLSPSPTSTPSLGATLVTDTAEVPALQLTLGISPFSSLALLDQPGGGAPIFGGLLRYSVMKNLPGSSIAPSTPFASAAFVSGVINGSTGVTETFDSFSAVNSFGGSTGEAPTSPVSTPLGFREVRALQGIAGAATLSPAAAGAVGSAFYSLPAPPTLPTPPFPASKTAVVFVTLITTSNASTYALLAAFADASTPASMKLLAFLASSLSNVTGLPPGNFTLSMPLPPTVSTAKRTTQRWAFDLSFLLPHIQAVVGGAVGLMVLVVCLAWLNWRGRGGEWGESSVDDGGESGGAGSSVPSKKGRLAWDAPGRASARAAGTALRNKLIAQRLAREKQVEWEESMARFDEVLSPETKRPRESSLLIGTPPPPPEDSPYSSQYPPKREEWGTRGWGTDHSPPPPPPPPPPPSEGREVVAAKYDYSGDDDDDDKGSVASSLFGGEGGTVENYAKGKEVRNSGSSPSSSIADLLKAINLDEKEIHRLTMDKDIPSVSDIMREADATALKLRLKLDSLTPFNSSKPITATTTPVINPATSPTIAPVSTKSGDELGGDAVAESLLLSSPSPRVVVEPLLPDFDFNDASTVSTSNSIGERKMPFMRRGGGGGGGGASVSTSVQTPRGGRKSVLAGAAGGVLSPANR